MTDHISVPKLPPPEIYELEYQFWPWGKLISAVEDRVAGMAPAGGLVVDYMCGTGYLLNRIASRRSDLKLYGCNINKDAVAYGKKLYTAVSIDCIDSLLFEPSASVDVAIATGGIHHLQPKQQVQFVHRVGEKISENGCFLVGEEVIPESSNKAARQLGTLKLSADLLAYVIEHDAPDAVLDAALNVMKRDMFCEGEYKSSLADLTAMLEDVFVIESCLCTWPGPDKDYGDYLLVCSPKKAP